MGIENDKGQNFPDATEYQDLSGMTASKLSYGLWFVEHAEALKNILIAFLALVSLVSWGYTLFSFSMYVAKGMRYDELLVGDIAKNKVNHEYVVSIAPKALEIGQANALTANGKIDFEVPVSNPNARHKGEFEYYFLSAGTETEKRTGFILPGEAKHLLALAQEGDGNDARVVIENVIWKRINAHEIADWQKFKHSRLDIPVTGIKYSVDEAVSGSSAMNRLQFDAFNNTAYNYWNVDFIILLYGGPGSLVAVNQYRLQEFMAGKTKQIEIVWPDNLPPVTEAVITPEIDIFRKDIYIKF